MTSEPPAPRRPSPRPRPADLPPVEEPPTTAPAAEDVASVPEAESQPEPEAESQSESEPDPATGAATSEAEPAGSGRVTRTQRRAAARRQGDRWLRVLLVAGLACAIGCGVAAWLLWPSGGSGKPAAASSSASTGPSTIVGSGAQLANSAVATAFQAGASADISAVTSYDYRDLPGALAAGLAVTTGSYQATYQAAMTGSLAATARQHHVVQVFSVLRVGIGAMAADGSQAQVLIFGQQQVTDDSTHGQPRVAPVTLCATMQRIGDRYLISNLTPDGDPGLATGTRDLQIAETAGATELANLLTYRRASFAADLQRALAGAANPLRQVVSSGAAATHEEMIRGKYDLSGGVTAIAVTAASGDTVTLLVAATSNRIGDAAGAIQTATVRYQLTVVRGSTGWLVSEAQSIGAVASS